MIPTQANPSAYDPEQIVSNGKAPIGFELFNRQRKPLGEIEEIIRLGLEPYCLVDTRHWTFGERRLLPLWAIEGVDPDRQTATTSLDMATIRAAPDFNPFRLNDSLHITVIKDHYRNQQRPSTNTSIDNRPTVVKHPWPFRACPPPCGGDTFLVAGGDHYLVFTCGSCGVRWRYVLGYLVLLDAAAGDR